MIKSLNLIMRFYYTNRSDTRLQRDLGIMSSKKKNKTKKIRKKIDYFGDICVKR